MPVYYSTVHHEPTAENASRGDKHTQKPLTVPYEIFTLIADILLDSIQETSYGEDLINHIRTHAVYAIDVNEAVKDQLITHAVKMRYLLVSFRLKPESVQGTMMTTFELDRGKMEKVVKENNNLDPENPVDQLLFLLKMHVK